MPGEFNGGTPRKTFGGIPGKVFERISLKNPNGKPEKNPTKLSGTLQDK